MCGSTSNTTTTSPPSAVLQNYTDVSNQAKGVAATPYQPYTGQLVAGLNQGQTDAIGELQSGYGVANPYLNSGSADLNNASAGLGNVQNYLQAGSRSVGAAQNYAGLAAALTGPGAAQAYMNPYTSSVINSTMAEAQNQDAIQAQQLNSNAIGQGAYGGDRAGIAQSSLAGQQALANNQTIAGLNSQNYSQGLAAAQSAAGIYGNLANSSNQSAGLYNSLGQTQGSTGAAYGTLANAAGNLGNIAQNTSTAGASAALQASTLQQQNAQAQDTAAYGQFQNAIQYPFQTTSYLANIEEGLGNGSGSSTTSPGASALSQATGAATAGLGILGAIGGSSGVSGGLSTVGSGLSSLFGSDERIKEDIEPIGQTYDGQTIHRYRYKGDPAVRMGLIAQEVEQHQPDAVHSLGGIKAVDYDMATVGAADRGHFARGGGLGAAVRHQFADGGASGAGLGGITIDMRAGGDGAYRQGGLGAVADRPRMPYAMSRLEAEQRGYKRPPSAFLGRPIGGNAYGDQGKPSYAVGGAVDDGSLDPSIFNPAPLSLTSNPNWTAAGLGVGQSTQAQPMGHLSAGGAGNASSALLSAPPVAQAPSLGLAAIAPSTNAGSGASGGLGAADANKQQNMWMGITAAGLGMMGGTSPQAGVNIGQGGLKGLEYFTTLQNQDRQNAVAQSDVAYKTGTLGLERTKVALELAQQQRAISGARAAAGLDPLDPSGSGGQPVAPGLAAAGAAAPTNGGGLVPPAALPAAPDAAPIGSPMPLAVPSTGGAPAPAATPSSFWSGVSPDSNPNVLTTRANAAQAYGDTAGADALRARAASIVDKGSVLMRDGSVKPIPGYLDRVSSQKAAEAQGEEAGKTQTVYDPDGNPVLVPGATYQQLAANGGGVVNGVPVTGGQSPYMKAAVENNADFSKNGISFEKDFQQNTYALGSLAHIYQSYTGGRGADAVADLDSYAKQLGIEGALPKNWQNASGGFDAAYKTAVDQSFKQLAESGATKAPATGLREALLTTPRPDADPAARYKVITDKLAALNYSHDMYSSFFSGNDPNVGRALVNFQKTARYGDYVSAARNGTPLPAGMSPSAGAMVLGPTGVQQAGPQQAQSAPSTSAPMAIPPAAQRTVGQTYMTPKGPARWMGGGWAAAGAR